MKNNTIFVQIASYRDPDCKNTIRDLYEKAKNPENIFIGLNWQYSADDEFEPYYKEDDYTDRIRIVEYDCQDSKGVCWARSKTQLLYQDETYSLQIDAHMRFVENWDEELFNMYNALLERGIEKPVISHYPPNFTLDGKYDTKQGKMATYIRNDGVVYFKLSGYCIDEYDEIPLPSASVAGGFLFADANCIKEVPYDPNLYFHGEEITLSVRLWTNGWNIFNPTKIIMYHLYQSTVDKKSGEKVKVREIKLHKDDNTDHKELEKNSVQRIKYLLGTDYGLSNGDAIKDLDQYSLGTQRSLYQYENYSGIDFKLLKRNHFARIGIFFNDITPTTQEDETAFLSKFDAPLKKVEKSLQISNLLKKLNITEIVGIKDHMFIENIDNSDFKYIGIDFVQKNIDALRYYFRLESNKIFYQQNVLREALPKADVILCSDFFAEAPLHFGWQLLVNIRKSKIRYILASNSEALVEKYSFPKPMLLIPYKDEYLGLWDCNDILIYLYSLSKEYAKTRRQLIPSLENKLETLKKIFVYHQKEFKEIVRRAHQNLNSTAAREITQEEGVKAILQENNNVGMTLMEEVFRIRFWSNEVKIIEEYPFIKSQDKQFILALVNEYLQNYEEAIIL